MKLDDSTINESTRVAVYHYDALEIQVIFFAVACDGLLQVYGLSKRDGKL
jgi:hypothetical protein